MSERETSRCGREERKKAEERRGKEGRKREGNAREPIFELAERPCRVKVGRGEEGEEEECWEPDQPVCPKTEEELGDDEVSSNGDRDTGDAEPAVSLPAGRSGSAEKKRR